MKKVKAVINGYRSQYDLDEIHIIRLEEHEVLYGGSLDGYLNPHVGGIDLSGYKAEVDAMGVKDSIIHNFSKLYLFV